MILGGGLWANQGLYSVWYPCVSLTEGDCLHPTKYSYCRVVNTCQIPTLTWGIWRLELLSMCFQVYMKCKKLTCIPSLYGMRDLTGFTARLKWPALTHHLCCFYSRYSPCCARSWRRVVAELLMLCWLLEMLLSCGRQWQRLGCYVVMMIYAWGGVGEWKNWQKVFFGSENAVSMRSYLATDADSISFLF